MCVVSIFKNIQIISWDLKFGIEVGMEYELLSIIGGVGVLVKSNFNYEWGGDEEDIIVNQDWYILKVIDKK